MTILILLLILIIRFVFFSFSLNSFKSVIESELSWVLETETSIEGNVYGSLFPVFSLKIHDALLTYSTKQYARVERAEFNLPLTKIFATYIEVSELKIINPVVTIIDDGLPTVMEEIEYTDDTVAWGFNLSDVSVENGNILYYSIITGDTLEVKGMNLYSDSIHVHANADTISLEDITAVGNISIGEARLNELILPDIGLRISMHDEKISITHSASISESETYMGEAVIDLSNEKPHYYIKQEINQFNIDQLLSKFSNDTLMIGKMDFKLNASFSGRTSSELWTSSTGNLLLQGRNLDIVGLDIDQMAKKFKRSQKFNMVDASALFLAGPVGIAVTKGRDFASLAVMNPGDSTHLNEFISKWTLRGGKLFTQDVAFSTTDNIIAIQGAVDVWGQRFDTLDVALVNDHGCPVLQQRLTGSIDSPEVSDVKIVKALIGPLKNIFKRKKCKEVFYDGSVLPEIE